MILLLLSVVRLQSRRSGRAGGRCASKSSRTESAGGHSEVSSGRSAARRSLRKPQRSLPGRGRTQRLRKRRFGSRHLPAKPTHPKRHLPNPFRSRLPGSREKKENIGQKVSFSVLCLVPARTFRASGRSLRVKEQSHRIRRRSLRSKQRTFGSWAVTQETAAVTPRPRADAASPKTALRIASPPSEANPPKASST
ncbi:hypothetical protein ALCH109712_05845 [Alkalicoccus chagannorensis]